MGLVACSEQLEEGTSSDDVLSLRSYTHPVIANWDSDVFGNNSGSFTYQVHLEVLQYADEFCLSLSSLDCVNTFFTNNYGLTPLGSEEAQTAFYLIENRDAMFTTTLTSVGNVQGLVTTRLHEEVLTLANFVGELELNDNSRNQILELQDAFHSQAAINGVSLLLSSYDYWTDESLSNVNDDDIQSLIHLDAFGYITGWVDAVLSEWEDTGQVVRENEWKRINRGFRVGAFASAGGRLAG
jgi:hypothetical protein